MNFVWWLLEKTAVVEPEITPYGVIHLAVAGGALLLFVAVLLLSRRSSYSAVRPTMLAAGIVMLLCEIYRSAFYYYVIGRAASVWTAVPMGVGTVTVLVCILIPLLPSCGFRRALCEYLVSFGAAAALYSLVAPQVILSQYSVLSIISLAQSIIILLLTAALCASGSACNYLRDFFRALPVFTAICAVSLTLNLTLGGLTGGQLSLFHMGPTAKLLPVFSLLAPLLPDFAVTAVYAVGFAAAGFAVYAIMFLTSGNRNRPAFEKTDKK